MKCTLDEIVRSGRAVAHEPWPRSLVSPEAWTSAARELAAGRLQLVAEWAEPQQVHAALFDPDVSSLGLISLAAPDGSFPALGAQHAPARRLERRIHDLFALEPLGAPDVRPWIDHGQFGDARLPSGKRGRNAAATDYTFLPVEGESLHQIPVGPVHAGIIEPGHFRFTASGETIVRLEERLGYVHRGIDSLLEGATLEGGCRIAARASGDTTVAYGLTFARAVEAATGTTVSARAAHLRALMVELERIANHLGDIGAICNDASFSFMHAHCSVLRERVLRAAEVAFGHRLMMDRVVPGGVSTDLSERDGRKVLALATLIRRRFTRLMRLYDETASLQDRTVGTGILRKEFADRFAAGGFVGRASGRAFDARKVAPFAPYDELAFGMSVETEGDVDARVRVRAREVEESLSLIEQIVARLPEGPLSIPLNGKSGEGSAVVEGFRGDIFVWVRLGEGGSVERACLRDPSWFQWPLLEAAIEGNIVADFPLCNKSFNCSYAGHDL
jgi:Ni,Fe-hydrogenase III large subunit